jgi:hypothetical protein
MQVTFLRYYVVTPGRFNVIMFLSFTFLTKDQIIIKWHNDVQGTQK